MLDEKQIRKFRKTLIQSDKPVAPGDEKYVVHLHGNGAEDVVALMKDDILLRPSEGSEVVYFTGQRGTGKSSELRRLEIELNGTVTDDGDKVQAVLFDCLDFMDDNTPITADILLLLVTAGLASWVASNTDLGDKFSTSTIWERFSGWLRSDVHLAEITLMNLKFKVKEQQKSLVDKVAALSANTKFLRELRDYAGEIVEFIRSNTQRKRIVVIVDSLEHLRGLTSADVANMFNYVTATFGANHERLKVLGATVVYSTPPYLALLSDLRNRVTCYSLASVRVYQKPVNGQRTSMQRLPREEGLELMRALVTKRYPQWDKALKREAIDALSLVSGGDLKHFLYRLLSDVVGQAQFALDRLPLAADNEIIQRVISQNRSEVERLTVQSEWSLLKSIRATHNAIAQDRADSLQTLAHLLETRVVLNYRNGSEWYDAHPLLWPLIDALPEPKSGA